jgi:nucleoside-diphosphate-sugar epimerase
MSTKVLFLGGGRIIKKAAAREADARGDDVTIITRSEPTRAIPERVRQLRGDVRDVRQLESLIGDEKFDAVVNWIGYETAHLDGHTELFGKVASHYVVISTCSVFARPVPLLPIPESSARRQSVFGYARGKLECEEYLEAAYRYDGLPVAIVRPFHTYDMTTIPLLSGWTAIERMRAGKGVIVHGDGTSPWTLMHSSDFARAFVPLLGNQHTIGESVNVVGGEILTWDQIHTTLGAAAGVREPALVHRASESIAAEWPGWGEVLEHDFRHAMLFDTTKLRRLVPDFAPRIPFSAGARQIIDHYEHNPGLQRVDAALDAAFDRLV